MSSARSSKNVLQTLLREISEQGEIRTSVLARKLGLSTSSIAAQALPLLRKDLAVWSEGRKRLGVNPDFGRVVGIDMGATNLRFALADFRGELLGTVTEKVRPEDGPRKTIEQIKKGIRQVAAAFETARAVKGSAGAAPLRGIAIGVPSPVDPRRGVVAFANNLPGWKNIHLGRELQKAFRLPVYLENDANMAALGERWRGVARGLNNFVFIALGTGIGSGVFLDGKIHRGRTGNAGELYRLNVEWPRWREDFGDVGYFESYVSGLGIAAEGRKQISTEDRGKISNFAQERDAQWVFELYRRGHPGARAVLEKVFAMLGVAVADLVAVLDPELIVLGGGVAQGASDFMLATVEKVARSIQKEVTPPIKLSSLGDKAQTYGAISSALTVAFEASTRGNG